MKGVDSTMLVKQVPGGMLSNLESQLKANNQEDKIDLVKEEIPKVRKRFWLPSSRYTGFSNNWRSSSIKRIMGKRSLWQPF